MYPSDPKWLAQYLDATRAKIAEHGHAVQFVFGDTILDQFSYTVGLAGKNRPELWLGSLSPRQAGAFLNDLVLHEPVENFVDGALVGGDRWSMPLKVRGPVDPFAAAIRISEALHPDVAVTCLQVLFPDPAGRFPDDDAYDQKGWPQVLLGYAVGAEPAS